MGCTWRSYSCQGNLRTTLVSLCLDRLNPHPQAPPAVVAAAADAAGATEHPTTQGDIKPPVKRKKERLHSHQGATSFQTISNHNNVMEGLDSTGVEKFIVPMQSEVVDLPKHETNIYFINHALHQESSSTRVMLLNHVENFLPFATVFVVVKLVLDGI